MLHTSGIFVSLIGAIITWRYSRPKIQILRTDKLNLEYYQASDEFTAPLDSELKIKINGKSNQNIRCILTNIKQITNMTANWRYSQATRYVKDNGTTSFPLQRGEIYELTIAHVENYNPPTETSEPTLIPVEYSILEINKPSDRIFQIGLTLFTTGIIIYFAS